MKKRLKKLLSLALIATCFLSCFACNSGGGTSDGRTKFVVFSYDGGYGTQWLRNAEAVYEKTHTDVDIEVQPEKTQTGDLSAAQINNSAAKLFFMENVSYAKLIAEDIVGDMTDILTEINPYDGKKIIDKYTDQQRKYYKVNDAYYGIPHYAGNNGFIYNKDFFDENLWYFRKNKPTGDDVITDDYFVTSATEERSYGPNGKTGIIDGVDYSFDDGLPATYKEFLILLDYIRSFNIQKLKPITVTGGNREQYVGLLYNALVADYEGRDQALINYTFEGVANDLGRIVDGKFIKDEQPTTVTHENGYEVTRQAGRYYALEFLSEIFRNTANYDVQAIRSGSDSNIVAQTRFARGQAAILIEGVWWESEAQNDVFGALGKSKTDYNFAWMPLPKADESKIGTETITDNIYSLCFMKKKLSEREREIAKDFVRFLYSDEMLSAFTRDTGTLKALEYEVKDADYSTLTPYGKSICNHKKASQIVYPFDNNAIFRNNQADFTGRKYYATSYKSYQYVSKMLIDDFISNGIAPDAGAYFGGMYDYYKNKWSSYNK